MIQDLKKIDELIILLSDTMALLTTDSNDKVREIIDNLLNIKLDILIKIKDEKGGIK